MARLLCYINTVFFESEHIKTLAKSWGIDLHMLERNLEISVEDRVLQHMQALDLLLELEKAREQLPK